MYKKAPLIRFNPGAVESMKVSSVRMAGDIPEMHFRAVPADELTDGSDWVKAA